jgi:hypothetical protein
MAQNKQSKQKIQFELAHRYASAAVKSGVTQKR